MVFWDVMFLGFWHKNCKFKTIKIYFLTGKPPAVPGNSPGLTFTGKFESLLKIEPPKLTKKETYAGR